MKYFYAAFTILPGFLFAHTGHPGAENHGDLTHFLIGLAVALPLALAAASIGIRIRKRAEVKVPKQD